MKGREGSGEEKDKRRTNQRDNTPDLNLGPKRRGWKWSAASDWLTADLWWPPSTGSRGWGENADPRVGAVERVELTEKASRPENGVVGDDG